MSKMKVLHPKIAAREHLTPDGKIKLQIFQTNTYTEDLRNLSIIKQGPKI